MNTIAKPQYTLIRALEGVRVTYPEVWEMLSRGLREMLEPEMLHIVRVPLDRLQISQGRAQVAQDILRIVEHCGVLAEQIRKEQATVADKSTPPRFQ